MRSYVFLSLLLLYSCNQEDSDIISNPEPIEDHLNSANRPVAKTEAWWQSLHIEDKRLVTQNSYDMLFIGNSITYNWETTGKEVWAERYAFNSLNMGIGSDRTQHLLWRIQDVDFTQSNPKLVVLLIGTNNTNGNVNSSSEVADGVIANCEVLKEKLPETKILVLGIFPRGDVESLQRTKVQQANNLVSKVADNERVFYANYGRIFLNEDNSINQDLVPDGVHPNLEGYRLWANEMDLSIASIVDK